MAEFLAIKNWPKYQSLNRAGTWIKDYTCQVDLDPAISKLSLFERGVLQECRRIRGKLGKNIPYDLGFLSRAMHATATDRSHLGHAIHRLRSDGFLVLTNQEDDSAISGEKDIKKKENKKDIKPCGQPAATADPRFSPFVEILNRYWKAFAAPKIKFEVWFGKVGGRNLKNLLKQRESLTEQEFESWLRARARSPGVNHAQPVNEWICRITDYAAGPKGANGNGRPSKAAERDAKIIADAMRYSAGAPGGAGENPLALPGNERTGVGRLDGDFELIPGGGSGRSAK